MVFKIDGLDITPFIAQGGIKWSRNDVDGPNAGRMLEDGRMERDRVAIKYRWDITCRPLTAEEQSTLLTAINPVYVNVTCIDPVANTLVTKECYSNNFPSTYLIHARNGKDYWTGLSFPLIER